MVDVNIGTDEELEARLRSVVRKEVTRNRIVHMRPFQSVADMQVRVNAGLELNDNTRLGKSALKKLVASTPAAQQLC